MRQRTFGFITIIFASCGQLDNFYEVTKSVTAPDTITIDKEFNFTLTLRNNTNKKIKLTIDRDVTKSIQFLPDWTCDNNLLIAKVPNPKSENSDSKIYYLNKSDSLTYNLKGQLSKYGTDSLKFTIVNYDRVFRLKRPGCKKFIMSLNGMWLPGDFNPLDAMEGYNFGQEIIVRE